MFFLPRGRRKEEHKQSEVSSFSVHDNGFYTRACWLCARCVSPFRSLFCPVSFSLSPSSLGYVFHFGHAVYYQVGWLATISSSFSFLSFRLCSIFLLSRETRKHIEGVTSRDSYGRPQHQAEFLMGLQRKLQSHAWREENNCVIRDKTK